MNNFTFGVLTFNSSKYVIETLESIKYQIESYGREWDCNLIISDDYSSDDTVSLVRKWVNENKKIFQNVDILVAEKNRGTVINYQKVFDCINTDFFHVIAGDDLFSSNNIFAYIKQLDNYDIVTTIPISFNNRGFFIEYTRLYRFIDCMKRRKWSSQQLVCKEMFGSFVHTPSTVFRKELYDKKAQQYVSKFCLFEDDPRWFIFFQKTTSILFTLNPIVLYRYHDESVCHIPNEKFKNDMLRLYADYIDVCKSWWLKIYLYSKYNSCKKFRRISFANFCRFLEGRIALIKVLMVKDERKKTEDVERIRINECLFYKEIANKSNKFMIAFKKDEEL